MDAEIVRAKMMEQVEQARQSAIANECGWTFEIDGLTVHATLRHRKKSEHVFLLRINFDEFPRRAPSYVFVDKNTKQVTSAAAPRGVLHSDNPQKICTPGTREFHEDLHRNDAAHPWDPSRYTFLSTVWEIHRLMERGLGA